MPSEGGAMAAGGSASERGRRAREEALALARRSREAYRLAGRFEAAAEAERVVAATLVGLTAVGWRLLVDRRWPGTRSANVDMILVGPGGVFVIDVKRWRDRPAVDAGHLTAGGERRDEEVRKLLAMTRTAEEQVGTLGLSPVALVPVIAFAGHRFDARIGRVRLLGHPDLVHALIGEPRRLTPALVRAVTAHLAEAFPAYEPTELEERGGTGPEDGGDALFQTEDVEKAALESLLHAPIERWMTFLHPDQVAVARRDWSGPARISGPAGTGKTVVGLHRAAHLAGRGHDRVLYATFVNNLPRVQRHLFERMAGVFADRVEFSSLHGWATAFLAERGAEVPLNAARADDAFSRAWMTAGRDSALAEIDPMPGYWREEIDHVIKGRGLTSLEEYRTVARHGRRTALQPAHREAAWLLYEEYELLREERGVADFNDVLLAALAELRERPADPPYSAVIVDEVQDLTLVGVKLLHALAGDGPNGLLLIGDGQQAVYPGGFRLSDAGIAVKGRGAVLRTNYRNAAAILEAAMDLVSGDPFDDLDGPSPNGRRAVDLTYHDGRVVRVEAADQEEHDRRLVEALRALAGEADGGSAWAGTVVLCPSRREIGRYHRLLTRAGIPVLRLEGYDGRPVEAVKLGTYRRAKGLEFKHVFLPCHDAALTAPSGDAAARERAELARRQLFVAMTRARDLLWLGSSGTTVNGSA
ncbi:nuclease-related domain-containing DEAD/DEAH box helicase [Actinomadura opuntiae]|uniref:nuclease-related domain-containing DEAD/DEAH box helicase n=1 Tax=Actinomadura sp. OS1-43 TaxID=604315 RepID=UPI00255B0870|nr:UvrD-helicase domain-containing protein [Actinomadura sp. OS1-43]MDL4817730.1 AAA family ATPase [Actinomadura sp. OS1-43]